MFARIRSGSAAPAAPLPPGAFSSLSIWYFSLRSSGRIFSITVRSRISSSTTGWSFTAFPVVFSTM